MVPSCQRAPCKWYDPEKVGLERFLATIDFTVHEKHDMS
jgi:hypothetical protein